MVTESIIHGSLDHSCLSQGPFLTRFQHVPSYLITEWYFESCNFRVQKKEFVRALRRSLELLEDRQSFRELAKDPRSSPELPRTRQCSKRLARAPRSSSNIPGACQSSQAIARARAIARAPRSLPALKGSLSEVSEGHSQAISKVQAIAKSSQEFTRTPRSSPELSEGH